MALLNSVSTHPPDGWKFLEARTALWIRGEIFDELIDAVIAHRTHKGLTPIDRPTVKLEIQRQICLGAPKGVCRGEPGEVYQPFEDIGRKLSLAKVGAASKTLVEWLKAGLNMVPKEESARRAEICRGCPFNKPLSHCICTPFWKLIDTLIPKERKEPGMYVCGLCGCSNAAKVLAPIEVVHEGNPPGLRLPSWCWQKV